MADARAQVRRARALLGRGDLPPSRFVVVTPGRAGSFFLSKLLDAHPMIRCDFELLQHKVPDVETMLAARATRAWREGKHAWGFFLHPPHLLASYVEDPQALVRQWCDEGIRPITLVRRNTVDHGVSASLLVAHGSAHHIGQETRRAAVRLDPADVLRHVQAAEIAAQSALTLVGEHSHLALVYEDDLLEPAQQNRTIDRITQYLGLPGPDQPLATDVVRRRTPFSELVENWDEVASVLGTTRWADLVRS